MQLPSEGVDRPQVARSVGVEVDPRGGQPKEPGLAVMGIGGEDRGADQVQMVGPRQVPGSPCVVGGPGVRGEDPLVGGTPDYTACDQDDRPGAGEREEPPATELRAWRLQGRNCRRVFLPC